MSQPRPRPPRALEGALRPGCCAALLLAASLWACAGSSDAPVAPANPALAVDGLFPTSGPVGGGTDIVVGGSGFEASATITFDGAPGTLVRFVSSHVMEVLTPAHPSGDVAVVVTNPDGRSTRSRISYHYDDAGEDPGPWGY